MSVFILLLHLCSIFSGSQIMFSSLVYVYHVYVLIYLLFFILILCLYFTLNFIAGQYADIIYVMCAKHYHEVNTRVPVNKRKKLKQCTFLLRVRMGIVCDLRGTIQCYLSEREREEGRFYIFFIDSFTARFISHVDFIS